jgi:hypothetical protein
MNLIAIFLGELKAIIELKKLLKDDIKTKGSDIKQPLEQPFKQPLVAPSINASVLVRLFLFRAI